MNMRQLPEYNKESKCISYILRHGADKIGTPITIDGYVTVSDLLSACGDQGYKISIEILYEIVALDSKCRYSFNSNRTAIRANQGHSLPVDLEFKKKIPPSVLYHGTSTTMIAVIRKTSIQKMRRTHVHLSDNINTALAVGARHGQPAIIHIDCAAMVADGIAFYQSVNNVWLVDNVNSKYITEITFKPSLIS